MSKKGILTKEEEKFFGKLIADEIKIGGILGTAIKLVAPMLIRMPDDNFGDRIPEPWQTYLEQLTSMVFIALQDGVITKEEEVEIATYCSRIMNVEVDLPLLEEDDEAVTFLFLWKWIASLLRKLVREKSE